MKKQLLIGFMFICGQFVFGQTHADTLMNQLLDINSNKVFVVSHRGDWRNAPENSLQAIQNCIDMGVDMVEIDLKKTKDNQIILMHDKKIDRTLTGKGAPDEYTLQELREMRMRNGAGHKTEHIIPTLKEAMLLAKGKILVNIDKGYDYFSDVYEILNNTGTLNQCIIKAEKSYNTVKEENPIALEKMVFMPVVNINKPEAADIIDEYAKQCSPKLYELVFNEDNAFARNVICKTRKSGAKLFVNSLWPELCGGHHDDLAVEVGDKNNSWGWLINNGVKIIQTDRPAKLLEYLRGRGLHE